MLEENAKKELLDSMRIIVETEKRIEKLEMGIAHLEQEQIKLNYFIKRLGLMKQGLSDTEIDYILHN